MIAKKKFIEESLTLNLFFLRIIKEHFIFLSASLMLKDKHLITQAELFKNAFSKLLRQTIVLSDGLLPEKLLKSNEYVTKYTLEAEKATQSLTGIFIDSSLTVMQSSLNPYQNSKKISPLLEDQVYRLNERIIKALTAVVNVKSKLIKDVLCCQLFTSAYPSLLQHVSEETVYYLEHLKKLQYSPESPHKEVVINKEKFWNHIMEEHSLFIRGMLDPSEEALFEIANNFSKEFDRLTKEASDFNKITHISPPLTVHTIKATTALRDFKGTATAGLLNCKIKSIILPLLSDHVLREANHYLNLLQPQILC